MKYITIVLLLFIVQSPVKTQDTVHTAPTPRFEICVLLGEQTGVSAKFCMEKC